MASAEKNTAYNELEARKRLKIRDIGCRITS